MPPDPISAFQVIRQHEAKDEDLAHHGISREGSAQASRCGRPIPTPGCSIQIANFKSWPISAREGKISPLLCVDMSVGLSHLDCPQSQRSGGHHWYRISGG